MIQELQNFEPDKSKPADGGEHVPKRTVLVRYGKISLVGQFRHSERVLPSLHTKVVVQTDRGLEMGEIISPTAAHRGCSCTIPNDKIDKYVAASGPNYPFIRNGRLVRLATVGDLNEARHIEASAQREGAYFKELVKKNNLVMKLVEVEHLFGGDRIIFYFMAEDRMDFRQLVRELGREYSTRVEMRQVGSRDEARLLGDFDTCGRELCCKNFLKVLQPVSMRMAKLQGASLDPSKISGRCGRLKCCLRYEDYGYQELAKNLPKIDTLVLTETGPGRVVDVMVLTQLVKIVLESSGRSVAINVVELLDLRYDPATSPSLTERLKEVDRKIDEKKHSEQGWVQHEPKPKPPAAQERQESRPRQEPQPPQGPRPPQQRQGEGSVQEGQGKRRRRRRRRRGGGGGGGGTSGGGGAGGGGSSQ